MDRNKKMIAVIAAICIVGAGMTAYTSRMVNQPAQMTAEDGIMTAGEAETVSPQTVLSPVDPVEAGADAEAQKGGETVGVVEGVPKNRKSKETQDMAESEVASPLETEIVIAEADEVGAYPEDAPAMKREGVAAAGGTADSGQASGDESAPLQGSEKREEVLIEAEDGASESSKVMIKETQSSYQKRLEELEVQVQNIRSQTGASNQYTIKNAADSEWRLWDAELSSIYNKILQSLSKEEAEKLVREEREWTISRDSEAARAARADGGSMESVEYRMSLAETTRERVYELAERYPQFLEDE